MKDIRKAAGMLLAVALLTALFAGSFIGAMHKPEPHDVPIAVVGPEQAVTQIQSALDAKADGAFELSAYATETDAREALDGRQVDAVLIPGQGASTLLTASAAGAAGATIIGKVFTTAAQAQGTTLTITDVRPLSAEDPSGSAMFFYLMSVLVPSLGGALMLAVGTRLRRTGLVTALVGVAVVVGGVAVAVADAATGVLPGAPARLFAVSVLASAAIAFTVAGLARLAGAGAGGAAALLFFPIGIPASGGPVGPRYIPEWYATVGSFLPPGATVEAVRNAVYFDGAALTRPTLVLACWIVAGLVLLAVGKKKAPEEKPVVARVEAVTV
ncbi:ABC transporter permease [Phytomonospora endophytica]|uniref:ABC transporter permease n=1 Tax=Phytomonospora endophytica TaxID=714109 RepID=A0A841FGU7_9ACTN|nr:ABC transporter permease [Phytomonospora endophytica]MBB6036541.1 hypothetical protein [Phytomonospora endophytica]GIG65863.1 membrane protein [Phytomonospora endophytica]